MATLATQAVGDANRVVGNARRAIRRLGPAASGRLRRAVEDLETLVCRTSRIVGQTRTRLSGTTPDGATRIVSLHDADARPIVKGRLGKPVEFGYKTQVADNPDGIVLDYDVHPGNPRDSDLLVPAVRRIAERVGKVPRAVTADRGYATTANDVDLDDLGVTTVAIPRPRPSNVRRQVERKHGFRQLVKWRTGVEGRISALKRGYGMDRTRIDGIDGARTWVGHAILAHNLVHVAALI